MRAWLQRATCGWGLALGACLLASCGDAAGNPIRSSEPDATAQHRDGGEPTRDASNSDPDPGWYPPMGGHPNQGPGSHDGRSNDDIPPIPYCFDAVNWSDDFQRDEAMMEQAINKWRGGRVDCGDNHEFSQLPPLRFPPALRCSARVHSFDLVRSRSTLDTRGSDQSQPGQRMTMAGFPHAASAESVWYSDSDAYSVLIDLLGNPDDCANFASREFTAAGVGEYKGVWTLDFAAEP